MLLLFCLACKKNKNAVLVEGTVLEHSGKTALVKIHNPDPGLYSFLCSHSQSVALPDSVKNNCAASIFITNLPEQLLVQGKQIRFTKFKDKGPRLIWSFSYAAHDVEVYDANEL